MHTAAPDKWDHVSIYDREQESQPSTQQHKQGKYLLHLFVNVCVLMCKWKRRTINTHTNIKKNQLPKEKLFAYRSAYA